MLLVSAQTTPESPMSAKTLGLPVTLFSLVPCATAAHTQICHKGSHTFILKTKKCNLMQGCDDW